MADRPNQDKTEKATPKRRQDARKKGQVAQSRELPSVMILMMSLGVFFFGGGSDVSEPRRIHGRRAEKCGPVSICRRRECRDIFNRHLPDDLQDPFAIDAGGFRGRTGRQCGPVRFFVQHRSPGAQVEQVEPPQRSQASVFLAFPGRAGQIDRKNPLRCRRGVSAAQKGTRADSVSDTAGCR